MKLNCVNRMGEGGDVCARSLKMRDKNTLKCDHLILFCFGILLLWWLFSHSIKIYKRSIFIVDDFEFGLWRHRQCVNGFCHFFFLHSSGCSIPSLSLSIGINSQCQASLCNQQKIHDDDDDDFYIEVSFRFHCSNPWTQRSSCLK